jgi:hypothetical protein
VSTRTSSLKNAHNHRTALEPLLLFMRNAVCGCDENASNLHDELVFGACIPFVFEARPHRNCRYRALIYIFFNTKECRSLLLEISLVEPDLSLSISKQHERLDDAASLIFFEQNFQGFFALRRNTVRNLKKKALFMLFFLFKSYFCKQHSYPKDYFEI